MTLQSPTATLIPLFSSSELTVCGCPGLLDRKNRSDMCPRWESSPRLPACQSSTLSTRPGSPHSALSLLMKHLVIGQRQKATNFSALCWSPHGSLISIGQHFVTTRVVHLPKMTKTSLITKADLIIESDQAVWAVHSCNSWFIRYFLP